MSETEAYEFRAPLSIVIDFKSPNAYLALRPSFELVDSLGIDVEWIPFAAEPIKPYAPVAADAPRGARHRWIRAQYWAKDLERYAERQGLTLKEIHRAPDVLLPGMGLQWLKQNAPDRIHSYLTQCFQGWWSGTLEIESEDAVAALIESTEFVASGATTCSEFESTICDVIQHCCPFRDSDRMFFPSGKTCNGRTHVYVVGLGCHQGPSKPLR